MLPDEHPGAAQHSANSERTGQSSCTKQSTRHGAPWLQHAKAGAVQHNFRQALGRARLGAGSARTELNRSGEHWDKRARGRPAHVKKSAGLNVSSWWTTSGLR